MDSPLCFNRVLTFVHRQPLPPALKEYWAQPAQTVKTASWQWQLYAFLCRHGQVAD